MAKTFIRIDVNAKDTIRRLDAIAKKHIPFALRTAATAVARIAAQDLQQSMQSAFRDPSPYTLNAFYAKPAKPSDPTAYVASREFAGKGRPAFRYLSPEVFGGPRGFKGFERLLGQQIGEQYTVPGTNVVLTRGQITQMLSRLNALRDPTQNISAKTTARLRKQKKTVAASGHRSEYFISHEGGDKNGRPTGIYRLVAPSQVQLVMALVPKAPNYTVRLPVEDIVRASVGRNWDREFQAALAHALATAK